MRRSVRPYAGLVVLLSALLPVMTACGDSRPSACGKVDSTFHDRLWKEKPTGYLAGDSTIDHDEFQKDAFYPVPKADQRFGVTRIYATRYVSWLADPASSETGGVEVTTLLATDGDGSFVTPLRAEDAAAFGLTPGDAEFQAWADQVQDIETGPDWVESALECVPH